MILLDGFEYSTDALAKAAWVSLEYYNISLLHFEGADASTTFTDETGKTWTRAGDAQIDTAQKKFGSASGLFDGTGDYITTPAHADFDIGESGESFTIDFWAYLNEAMGANYRGPVGYGGGTGAWNSSNGHRYLIMINNLNQKINFQYYIGGTSRELVESTNTIDVDGGFHHFAFVNNSSGNTFTIYIDGTSVIQTTKITISHTSAASEMVVGNQSGYAYPFIGWIDEFEILKGVARWTGNFTSPANPYPLLGIAKESTIIKNGTYSMKVSATATDSLNKTAVKTFSPVFNLSGQNTIYFWAYASRTGSNFKLGFHDSGGTTTEVTPNIASANTWQLCSCDISAVTSANKDAIDTVTLTITNADSANTIYLDYLLADNVTWPDKKYVYYGIGLGDPDGTTGTLHASTLHSNTGIAGSDLSAGILKDDEVVDDVTGTYTGTGTGGGGNLVGASALVS